MSQARCISDKEPHAVESPGSRWHERRWVHVLTSVVLIAALLSSVDIDRVHLVESAKRVRWWPVAMALLLRPVAVWARAWQAALLLRSIGLGLGVRDVWRAFMFGELLSRFVPANLGTVAYVAKLSQRTVVAVVAQVVDRVLFLLLTLLVSVLTLLGAGHDFFGVIALVALLGTLLLALGVYQGVVRWIPLGPDRREAIQSLLRDRKQWAAPYLLASTLSLALTAVLFELLVVACGGTVRILEGVAAVALVTIGAAAPITVNGIGIREWVFVAVLKETMPSNEGVVTLAAMTYLFGFASALVGVGAWALSARKV